MRVVVKKTLAYNTRIDALFAGRARWLVGYGRNVWAGVKTRSGWVRPIVAVSVPPTFCPALSSLGGAS